MPEGRIDVFLGCQKPEDCTALLTFLPNETRHHFEEDCATERLQHAFDELEMIEPPGSIRQFDSHGLILSYDGLEIEELAEAEDKKVRDYLQSLFVQLKEAGVDEFMVSFASLEGYNTPHKLDQ